MGERERAGGRVFVDPGQGRACLDPAKEGTGVFGSRSREGIAWIQRREGRVCLDPVKGGACVFGSSEGSGVCVWIQ